MQKWEYRTIHRIRQIRTIHRIRQIKYEGKEAWINYGSWTPADIDAELNKLGAEGWELVSVSPRSNRGSNGEFSGGARGYYPIVAGMTDSEIWVFKRPVG